MNTMNFPKPVMSYDLKQRLATVDNLLKSHYAQLSCYAQGKRLSVIDVAIQVADSDKLSLSTIENNESP